MEDQADYLAENGYVTEAMELLRGENAAEIHPPKTIKAIRDKGLEEYKVWGWVKISANFIHHIKKLKGAKLAIWQVISLSIDEYSSCNLSIHEIADLSGYSYSETQASLKELDDMGYLSIDTEKGKKSIYSPSFAARGSSQPDDNPSRNKRGTEGIPLQSSGGDPSSPSDKNIALPFKELKELIPLSLENSIAVNQHIKENQQEKTEREALDSFERDMQLPANWQWFPAKASDEKAMAHLRNFIVTEYVKDKLVFEKYNTWRNQPYVKGAMSNLSIKRNPENFPVSWSDYLAHSAMYGRKTDETRPQYDALAAAIEREKHAVPRPANLPPPNIKRHTL